MSEPIPTADKYAKTITEFIEHLKFEEESLQRKYEDALLEKSNVQKLRMDFENRLYKGGLIK